MKFLSLLIGLGTLFGAAALAHSGATGIVKERMDMFKRSQKNLKAIKSQIRGEDYGSIAKLADEIREWAVKMPEYFPEGSDVKPSEASPKIWEDFDGFKRAAMKNEMTTKKLIAAAEAGDQNAVVEGFKAVASSCKSCHQSYKLDQQHAQGLTVDEAVEHPLKKMMFDIFDELKARYIDIETLEGSLN